MIPITLTYYPKSILCLARVFTFSAKEKDQETGFSVTSLRSVSSSSLSQCQTSLAWHSLIRRFGSRYYSSDLSIWLSVDPMSDKYPSLSPYAYCADNPIKLVDPNGEDIVILSSDGQNLYKYVDGKLFNAKTKEEYQGGDSFVDNAKSNLDKLSESKTGRTIIKDLQEAGYTATIFKNDAKSMFNTQEDGSSIGWKQSGDDVSTTGGLLANGTISLAHELIHSYDHKHGGDMGKDETNASIYEGLPRCEWIAVYHENAIRQELFGNNASLRDYYSKSNDSFTAKGTGPKLLDANNRPRLAKGISPLF